ncbi:MAG: hypothetical protein ACK5M3_00670 [Dysgonomonas sp.]
MKKLSLCLLVFVSLFFSCQNDEGEYEKVTPDLKLEFSYDGVLYSSAYHYSSDSIVIVDDEKVSEVYSMLMENEQLATVVGEDGGIVYYDNYESVDGILRKSLDTKNTKSTSANLSLYLYEHIGYTGNVVNESGSSEVNIATLEYYYWNIGLSRQSANDKVTSIIANFSYRSSDPIIGNSIPSGAVLTIFEHKDYGGKSLSFKSRFTSYNGVLGMVNNSGQIKVNTLIDYKMKSGGLFHSDTSWNDQMSSAKFTFYKE